MGRFQPVPPVTAAPGNPKLPPILAKTAERPRALTPSRAGGGLGALPGVTAGDTYERRPAVDTYEGERDVRFGRRSRATAVAAAVIGGLLGSVVVAPAASAAPAEPGSHAGDRAGRAETAPPPVWPRPQSMRTTGPAVKLGAEATLAAAPDAAAPRGDAHPGGGLLAGPGRGASPSLLGQGGERPPPQGERRAGGVLVFGTAPGTPRDRAGHRRSPDSHYGGHGRRAGPRLPRRGRYRRCRW